MNTTVENPAEPAEAAVTVPKADETPMDQPAGDSPPENPAKPTEPAQPGEPKGAKPGAKESPGEAAKYRKRLRETEAERDALAAQLQQARDLALGQHIGGTIEIETQGAEGARPRQRLVELNNPADVFTIGGLSHDDCWTEDGSLDVEKIRGAVQQLVETRPELVKRGKPVPTIGQQPGRPAQTHDWQDAFAPKTRNR